MDKLDEIGGGDGIGGLKSVRCLGSGAVGEVWLAHDAAGREVALKRIPIDKRRGRSVHTRELAALELLANRLGEQSGLIHVFHVGITDDELWYTMELADLVGEPPMVLSLDRAIESAKRFTGPDALDIIEHLLEGVGGLHDAGVVHRDIKPTNILSVGGEWKLGDIGLLSEERTEMTAVGTPEFIPPWGPIDRRADLYAMGRVLYCMATGLTARAFPTLPDELLTPERQHETKLMNSLVLRACDPDPDKRFQTAEEFIAEVRKARKEISMGEGLLTRRRAVVVGGGVIAAALVAPMVWPIIRNKAKSAPKWISLFDGKTLDGWETSVLPYAGNWFVRDGEIACMRDQGYKQLYTKRKFQYGRFRSVMTPDHDRARLGLLYGYPEASFFVLYEDKYLWIKKTKLSDDPEELDRWRSFPSTMIPKAGQSVAMELDWGPDRTRLFINGKLLQEVPGLPRPGQVGFYVWGKEEGDEQGDSGSFRDIEFQPRA